jgi:fatty acid desaturase
MPPRGRYASLMNEIEQSRSRPPILKRAAAGLVLVVVAALAFHLVIGLIMTVFWIVAIVAVIAAVVWALNTIL